MFKCKKFSNNVTHCHVFHVGFVHFQSSQISVFRTPGHSHPLWKIIREIASLCIYMHDLRFKQPTFLLIYFTFVRRTRYPDFTFRTKIKQRTSGYRGYTVILNVRHKTSKLYFFPVMFIELVLYLWEFELKRTCKSMVLSNSGKLRRNTGPCVIETK